jgi:hypothetical protein
MQGVADYGKLGHGECVGLKVPAANVKDFATVYFDLFDKNGARVPQRVPSGKFVCSCVCGQNFF